MSANNEQRKMEILNEINDELEIENLYKTEMDVDKRYYDLISALKVTHGDLIFTMKLDGWDLKKVRFNTEKTTTAYFDFVNKNNEKCEKGEIETFELNHKCDLFHPVDHYIYQQMDHSIPVALEEIAEQEYDNDEARRTLHALDTGDFNHLAARYEKYEDELLS